MKSLKDRFLDLITALFFLFVLCGSIVAFGTVGFIIHHAVTFEEAKAVAPDTTVVVVGDEEVETTVVEEIVLQANEHGVDVETALRIAWCESRYDDYARNPVSTASGVYQITKPTFEDARRLYFFDKTWHNIFDYKLNIEIAMWYMSRGEYWRWNASASCWKYEETK